MNRKTLFLAISGAVLTGLVVVIVLHHSSSNQAVNTNSDSVVTHKGSGTSDSSASKNTLANGSTVIIDTSALPADLDVAITSAITNQAAGNTASAGDFTITSQSTPAPGWVVAHIAPTNGADPGTVILRSNGPDSPMSVVAGPTTQFSKSVLDQAAVPKAVRALVGVRDE